jgi:hypothetical protein
MDRRRLEVIMGLTSVSAAVLATLVDLPCVAAGHRAGIGGIGM